MVEAVIMFCWIATAETGWQKDCELFSHRMHHSQTIRNCRAFLAFKIKEVKNDGARVEMAQCVIRRFS